MSRGTQRDPGGAEKERLLPHLTSYGLGLGLSQSHSQNKAGSPGCQTQDPRGPVRGARGRARQSARIPAHVPCARNGARACPAAGCGLLFSGVIDQASPWGCCLLAPRSRVGSTFGAEFFEGGREWGWEREKSSFKCRYRLLTWDCRKFFPLKC